MHEPKTQVIHSFKKHFILFLGVFTLIYAFMMPDSSTWIEDYKKILLNQAYLVHDFIEVGGISATFINVAIHFFVAYYLIITNDISDLYGLQFAAIGLFVGHSFFGSNLLNIFPLILGVFLYAKWAGHSPKRYTAVSLFSCAMSPIVSFIVFYNGFSIRNCILGIGLGIILGFISVPFAEEFLKFHRGFTLYNFGFTTGMIAMLVISFFSVIGYEIQPVYILSTKAHIYLVIYMFAIIFIFMGISFVHFKSICKNYPRLLKSSGRTPTDFVSSFGYATTLFNISFTTLIFFVFLLNTNFPLNGTLLGGLLSIMGFAAFGKHPVNTIFVALGVIAAGLLKGYGIANQSILLTLLFSTGLAPISGYYGAIFGFIAGFVHSNLTSIVMNLHLGMSLYNNGFTSAFVAALISLIAELVLRHRKDEMI